MGRKKANNKRNTRKMGRENKNLQKSQGRLLLAELKKTFKPKWKIVVDQSLANIFFLNHGKPEMMNQGYDLAAAKEMTEHDNS